MAFASEDWGPDCDSNKSVAHAALCPYYRIEAVRMTLALRNVQ